MRVFLPEWAPQEAIMMAMPNAGTDWNYILSDAIDQYRRIIVALCQEKIKIILLCRDVTEAKCVLEGCDHSNIVFVECPINDTWIRDYGPISVVSDNHLNALDFGFNGWGLKFASDKDNLVNLHLQEMSIVFKDDVYRNERDFILEGGSVETDGKGTILTTTRCLCSPNRNGGLDKKEIEKQLRSRLGAIHVLFLDYGYLEGDDTDSHIDTLARLAPENIILFTGCRDMDDHHFEEFLKMRAQLSMFRTLEGDPFNLIELPMPGAIYDKEGNRLPATYANFLVTDKVVFVPTYSQPDTDLLALHTIKVAYPDHRIVGIECTTLLMQHGSLHCATMQLPKGICEPQLISSSHTKV